MLGNSSEVKTGGDKHNSIIISPKLSKVEILVWYYKFPVKVLGHCVKFQQSLFSSFKLCSKQEKSIRAIIWNLSKVELWILFISILVSFLCHCTKFQ